MSVLTSDVVDGVNLDIKSDSMFQRMKMTKITDGNVSAEILRLGKVKNENQRQYNSN